MFEDYLFQPIEFPDSKTPLFTHNKYRKREGLTECTEDLRQTDSKSMSFCTWPGHFFTTGSLDLLCSLPEMPSVVIS